VPVSSVLSSAVLSAIRAFARSVVRIRARLQHPSLAYLFPVYTMSGSLQYRHSYSSIPRNEFVCYRMGNDLRKNHADFLRSDNPGEKSYTYCKPLAYYSKDMLPLCSENITYAPCNIYIYMCVCERCIVIANYHKVHKHYAKKFMKRHFKLTQTCSHL
jgi:hypothetical protein